MKGHIGDESFQAITCTNTNNSKQTTENTPKTQKTQNKQIGSAQKKHKNLKRNLNQKALVHQ